MLCVIKDFTGNAVGYASYFFEKLGLSTENSYYMGLGVSGIGFVGTVFAVFLIRYWGHRTVFLFGIVAPIVILFTVEFMSLLANYIHADPAIGCPQAAMLILLQFILICEMPSMRLRSKTVSMTAMLGAITGLCLSTIGPYFLNHGAVNAGGKVEFLSSGVLIFAFISCFLRLSELKGRTFEECDIMFAKKRSHEIVCQVRICQ